MLSLVEVADLLEEERPHILKKWRSQVDADPQVGASTRLSRVQFNDHIPIVLDAFGVRLRQGTSTQEEGEREASEAHGRHRWQQGYDLRAMVREWGHLNEVLVAWMGENDAPASTYLLWAEFLAINEAEAAALYEDLLKEEAHAKLRDVEQALEGLQEWERRRGELLRQTSHDLRGSLTVVVSASDLLGDTDISDEHRTQLFTLLDSGVRNMTSLMGNMLDMARLEAGVEKRELRAVDVGRLFSSQHSAWQPLAEEKGLTLVSNGPDTLWVEGDSSKIQRIVQNLALNAIKYTEQGTVSMTWGEADSQQWFIEVSDTGVGLQTSDAARFAKTLESAAPDAPYSDLKPQTTPQTPQGEGIGLAIVRRLCELLYASVELRSTSEGSMFRVTFPREYEN